MQADFNRPVLAVDTGTSYLSLALRADGETRLFHQEAGSRQSELILPEIRTLFRNAGITAADLGAIVYAKGPGAFTGLRIGIGVAQGLATPFDTPLIGIPTLDAVCNPSAWTQRQFESALVSPSEQVWLVEQNNTLSAFIVWQNLPDESELHLIATTLEYHRWGVASALLRHWFANLPESLLSYRIHTAQESKKKDKINRSVQYTMELWFSHLFPELNPVKVTLLSRILHEKKLSLTTEELKTIFAVYDRISKDRSISLFGEDRNTMFDMIDKFFNFLKSQLKFT